MKEKAYNEKYIVSNRNKFSSAVEKENKDPRQHHDKKDWGKRELEVMNKDGSGEVKKFRSTVEKENWKESKAKKKSPREDRKKLLVRIPLARFGERIVKRLKEESLREDNRKFVIRIPPTRTGERIVKKFSYLVEKRNVREGGREKSGNQHLICLTQKIKKDSVGKKLKGKSSEEKQQTLGGDRGKKEKVAVACVFQKWRNAPCLPNEVWLMILRYLDEVSLLNFSQMASDLSVFADDNEKVWRGRTLNLTAVSLQALTMAQLKPKSYPSPTCLVLHDVPSKEALAVISPHQMRSVEINCGKMDASVAKYLVKLLKEGKQLKQLKVKGGGALRKLLREVVCNIEEFSFTRACFEGKQKKDAIQLINKLFEVTASEEGGVLQSLTLDLPLSSVPTCSLTAVLATLRHVDLTNPEFTMEQALAVTQAWSSMEPALESLALRGRILAAHGGPADANSQMPIGHLGQAEAPLVRAASRVASLTFQKCTSVGQLVPQLLQTIAKSSSVRKVEINNVKCAEEVF